MVIFNKIWKVINLSTRVKDKELDEWIVLAGIPKCFTFEHTIGVVETLQWGESKWPWPTEPWTIVVSDHDDPNYPRVDDGNMGGSMNNRCSVAIVKDVDFPLQIGARIWHEQLHCMDIDSDQMDKKDKTGFCGWILDLPKELSENRQDLGLMWCAGTVKLTEKESAEVLCSYYTYLTKKNFPDCYKQPTLKLTEILRKIMEFILKFFKKH